MCTYFSPLCTPVVYHPAVLFKEAHSFLWKDGQKNLPTCLCDMFAQYFANKVVLIHSSFISLWKNSEVVIGKSLAHVKWNLFQPMNLVEVDGVPFR